MTYEASARTREEVPEVPGVVSADQVLASGRSIARLQRADGMIPWFEGGHCDPWNHVEAVMALGICGLVEEARRAFDWLEATQLPDGSWFNYYLDHAVEDPRIDTNTCAYVATGLWHHALVTGELDVLDRHWSMLERAVDFVLRWQRPDGTVAWSLDLAGRAERYALLTGSSSIFHSLRCAIAVADAVERSRPEWELAAGRLGHVVATHPSYFEPKDEFAMDWYYPVLTGAVCGSGAVRRIEARWDQFVLDGRGVRCVSGSDWVTAAESAECAIALRACGMDDEAREILACCQALRLEDGSYWTGVVYPGGVTFPSQERTTYTAAAVVLAADALSGASGASGIFCGSLLPGALDLVVGCAGAELTRCERLPGSRGGEAPEGSRTLPAAPRHPSRPRHTTARRAAAPHLPDR